MNKKADIIKIRGFLIKTNLYANKDEIDFIYKMIKERCDHLKGDLWKKLIVALILCLSLSGCSQNQATDPEDITEV